MYCISLDLAEEEVFFCPPADVQVVGHANTYIQHICTPPTVADLVNSEMHHGPRGHRCFGRPSELVGYSLPQTCGVQRTSVLLCLLVASQRHRGYYIDLCDTSTAIRGVQPPAKFRSRRLHEDGPIQDVCNAAGLECFEAARKGILTT